MREMQYAADPITKNDVLRWIAQPDAMNTLSGIVLPSQRMCLYLHEPDHILRTFHITLTESAKTTVNKFMHGLNMRRRGFAIYDRMSITRAECAALLQMSVKRLPPGASMDLTIRWQTVRFYADTPREKLDAYLHLGSRCGDFIFYMQNMNDDPMRGRNMFMVCSTHGSGFRVSFVDLRTGGTAQTQRRAEEYHAMHALSFIRYADDSIDSSHVPPQHIGQLVRHMLTDMLDFRVCMQFTLRMSFDARHVSDTRLTKRDLDILFSCTR